MTNKIALALLVSAIFSTACSGGGGGGGGNLEPCCGAEGQTDPAPSNGPAFGGGATVVARFAQPVVLSSSSCISLDEPFILLPEFDAVGKRVEVDAAGHYQVNIDERGVGREVAIRVFDELSDGQEVDRGIAYLAQPPVANPSATPIPVAPIRFVGQVFSETTIEGAAYCHMKRSASGSGDDLQNLTLPDIRAAVTERFASTFVAGTNGEAVISVLRDYRHAVNGLVDPAKNGGYEVTDELRTLRRTIDEEVDACLAGRTGLVSDEACLTGADFYRYWLYTHAQGIEFEPSLPEGFRNHLLVTAQDMSDALSIVDAADRYRMELLRNNYRLRLEIQAESTRLAVRCFGDTVPGTCDDSTGPTMTADPLAIGSIEAVLDRTRANLDAAGTPSDLSNVLYQAGLDISSNFGAQIGIAGDQLFFNTQGHANAAQGAIGDNFSHEQIAGELYGPAGALAATRADVDTTYSTQFPNADDRKFLAEIAFYANASAVPLVIDDTQGGF